MDLKAIAEIWLKENDYDGLFSEDVCGCDFDTLMRCEEPRGDCEAGIKIPCPKECSEGCNYHITSRTEQSEKIRIKGNL